MFTKCLSRVTIKIYDKELWSPLQSSNAIDKSFNGNELIPQPIGLIGEIPSIREAKDLRLVEALRVAQLKDLRLHRVKSAKLAAQN